MNSSSGARTHPRFRRSIRPGKFPSCAMATRLCSNSRAIAHYIDDHFDGEPLTPRTKQGDAEVEQWVSYVNTITDPLMIRRYLFAYLFPKTADKNPDRAAIDAMQPELAREVEVLELRAWKERSPRRRPLDACGHLPDADHRLREADARGRTARRQGKKPLCVLRSQRRAGELQEARSPRPAAGDARYKRSPDIGKIRHVVVA